MLMTNFLKNRRSNREFRQKDIDVDLLERIQGVLKDLDQEGMNSINLHLYENGDILFNKLKGIGGYAGVMIESPHYIGLEVLKDEESSIIYGAYFMEKLITKLNNFGIDTCWVSLGAVNEDIKKEVFGDIKGNINYLLALGYGKRKNPFVNEPFSERMGVEELVYDGQIGNKIDIKDLENRGLDDLFYYVRFAPSAFNKQPWRFILDNDRVRLLLKYKDDKDLNLMDAGVIMYYFEELAQVAGINSKWNLLDLPDYDYGENKYKYIGELQL